VQEARCQRGVRRGQQAPGRVAVAQGGKGGVIQGRQFAVSVVCQEAVGLWEGVGLAKRLLEPVAVQCYAELVMTTKAGARVYVRFQLV